MATWADVTLREFDAINVLENDPIAALNKYWDDLHNNPANIFRDDVPNRLTEEGVAWIKELQARLHDLAIQRWTARDITPWREIARELLNELGFMAVCNAAKIARGER